MKRNITFFLFVICVFVMRGSSQCDTTKVFFALNKATINPTHDNYAESMKKFIGDIVTAAASGTLDSVSVYGYASPDGRLLRNYDLSVKRCNALANYISRHADIPLSLIHTHPGGAAWDELRTLVIDNHLTPQRQSVLEILDKYLPEASSDPAASAKCLESLKRLDNGLTYEWMAANLLPELRYSMAVTVYSAPETISVHPPIEVKKFIITPPDLYFLTFDTEAFPSHIDPVFPSSYRPLHRLAIKTNLLYYAALLPNIEVEWRIDDRWSVALEYDMAWWGSYAKEKSYRLAILSPEVKRWIRPHAPWHGFYVGAFAGGGLYDFENVGPGYSGEGVMGGLSAGYMWPVTRNLSFEAAIGAGYMYTRYKEYKPLDGHHVYQRTKDLHYFGPLKLKFSLVWRLWDINKKRYNALREETRLRYEK